MGCDIHCHAERRADGAWEKVAVSEPFSYRSYGVFGFLAGVRNYSGVPQIAEQRGFPADASHDVAIDYNDWASDAHSASWLTVEELSGFDYDAAMEDRRVSREVFPGVWIGGCTCEPGEGELTTFREFLGKGFFDELRKLQDSGAERIVFWFDN